MRRGSKSNALKHGIFVAIFANGEEGNADRAKYLLFLTGLRGAFCPSDYFEELEIEKMAISHVRLWRLYEADLRIAPKLFARVAEALEEDRPEVPTQFVSKEDEVVLARKDPTPELVMRYEASLERQIGRALSLLEQWRRMRDGGAPS
jgi:hypothetical protein